MPTGVPVRGRVVPPKARVTNFLARAPQDDPVVTQVSTKSSPGKQETTTSVLTSTVPIPSQTARPQPHQDQTAAGPVAGGVVGGVVGLALLLTLAYLIVRRIRNQRATRALDSAFAEAGVGGGGVDRRTRMRPTQVEEPWLPMSRSDLAPAMQDSHSGQHSLGRSDVYYASPMRQPYTQEMELGVRSEMPKAPVQSGQSMVNWTEYQPGPAARQMNALQDEPAYPAPSEQTVLHPASPIAASNLESAPVVDPSTIPVQKTRKVSTTSNHSGDVFRNSLETRRPMAERIEGVTVSGTSNCAAHPDTTAMVPNGTPGSVSTVPYGSTTQVHGRDTLPRLVTDSLQAEENSGGLQSPSSAFMWLPNHRFTESETDRMSRKNTIASRPPMLRSESNIQDSVEEQELGNKLWRAKGTLRVANES